MQIHRCPIISHGLVIILSSLLVSQSTDLEIFRNSLLFFHQFAEIFWLRDCTTSASVLWPVTQAVSKLSRVKLLMIGAGLSKLPGPFHKIEKEGLLYWPAGWSWMMASEGADATVNWEPLSSQQRSQLKPEGMLGLPLLSTLEGGRNRARCWLEMTVGSRLEVSVQRCWVCDLCDCARQQELSGQSHRWRSEPLALSSRRGSRSSQLHCCLYCG